MPLNIVIYPASFILNAFNILFQKRISNRLLRDMGAVGFNSPQGKL